MRHQPKIGPDVSGSNWLLPFNDMMTLLLTFFVLILSLSKIDAARVQTASYAVSDALGLALEEENAVVRVFDPFVLSEQGEENGTAAPGQEKKEMPWGSALDREALAARLNRIQGVHARLTAAGMEVSFAEEIFFRKGSTDFTAQNHPGFLTLLGALEKSDASVRVEDHTADLPAGGRKLASGWELSMARAAEVAAALSTGGIRAQRISVAGYAVSGRSASGSLGHKGISDRLDIKLTFNAK